MTLRTPPPPPPYKPRLPKELSVSTTRPPKASDSNLAIAKVKQDAASASGFSNSARAAGLVKLQDGVTWMHPLDRSWVQFNDGSPIFGVRTTELEGPPPQRLVQADAALKDKLKAMMNETPNIPRSMKRYALAKIGVVDVGSAPSVCARAGFVQIGQKWVHPDGSWVSTQGGYVQVGWKGHPLSALPYQRGWL